MPSKKLSVTKAAAYGVFFGLAYTAFIAFSEIDQFPLAHTVGRLIGGAFGGAILFAGVAALANLFRK